MNPFVDVVIAKNACLFPRFPSSGASVRANAQPGLHSRDSKILVSAGLAYFERELAIATCYRTMPAGLSICHG